jgi:hypothetical protein
MQSGHAVTSLVNVPIYLVGQLSHTPFVPKVMSIKWSILLSDLTNLEEFLRLFVKEEAFFFKPPTIQGPVTSVRQVIQFQPKPRGGDTKAVRRPAGIGATLSNQRSGR